MNCRATAERVQLLEPRLVPLGGPRAMTVRRTLPQRGRSAHRAVVLHRPLRSGRRRRNRRDGRPAASAHRPADGQLAVRRRDRAPGLLRRPRDGAPGRAEPHDRGRGIPHSEVSTPDTTVLHGVQLWVALPGCRPPRRPGLRALRPADVVESTGATVARLPRQLAGRDLSGATAFSPIVGAQLDLPAGTATRHPGRLWLRARSAGRRRRGHGRRLLLPADHLGYRPAGAATLSIVPASSRHASCSSAAHRSASRSSCGGTSSAAATTRVVDFRSQWQADVVGQQSPDGRFGTVRGYDGRPLPAPPMPNVRLRPRD